MAKYTAEQVIESVLMKIQDLLDEDGDIMEIRQSLDAIGRHVRIIREENSEEE